MARGKDVHDARKAAVAALGRELSRRASSRCELCEASGTLRVCEVPPTDEEPDLLRAALLCERCGSLVSNGLPKRVNTDELRFLEQAIWSELLPVQLAAVRLCRALAARDVPWAREAADNLWLDDETQALLG